nr:hypothetical protein [Candidatus Pantoea carbekii]
MNSNIITYKKSKYTTERYLISPSSTINGQRLQSKVIYETQSTHKLLASLSRASLMHIAY